MPQQHLPQQQKHLRLYRLLALVLLVVAQPLWAQAPAGTALAETQILHRGNESEPQSLDPHKSEGTPSSRIQEDLFEGLVSESLSGETIPGVAERWEISEDQSQYLFYLRKNARWSNGDPLTAEDFVYSFQRIVDPTTASRRSQLMFPIKNAQAINRGELPPSALGVIARNEYLLEINLEGPIPYFLTLLIHPAGFPVHRGAIEEHGDKYSRPGNLISNGAYKLTEWEVSSHIKSVRNEHYWDNRNTTVNEVYYYPITNENSELQRYRAGDLHLTGAAPLSQIDWLRENYPNEFIIAPYLGIYYYGFNTTQPPFRGNPKLRQALTMAIDREIITDKLLRDGSIPAYSFIPDGVVGYSGPRYDWESWPDEQRLAKARQLYKEAGYGEDNPLRIELRYNTTNMHRRIGLAVAAMWKQNLGVYTTMINQEWKVFLDVRNQRRITEVFRSGWIGDYNDPAAFLDILVSDSPMNNAGYLSADYDKLMAASAIESNAEQRFQNFVDAEQKMLNDYPVMPIYYYVTRRLVSQKLGGYENNIMDRHYSKYMYIRK